MSEVIWHHLIVCTDEIPDFNFKNEDEYWDIYDKIIDTIGSISIEWSNTDPDGNLHQVIATTPLEFEDLELEDEDERE